MRKALYFLLCLATILSLAACGGVTVDLNTPKSVELKAQYDFYEKSVANIRVGMSVTPEQSDEIFLAFVSVGASSEIRGVRKITGADNTYSVNWTGDLGSHEVDIVGGVAVEIRQHSIILYPFENSTEFLNEQAINNVSSLIEGLNPDSSRAEYEAAQIAFESLSNSLKKQISESLVEKLSQYGFSTMTIEAAVDFAIDSANATKDSVMITGNAETDAETDVIVSIYLKGSDNLTMNMIRGGMLMKSNDILKLLQARPEISRIMILWTFPLTDTFGNTKEEPVLKIQLERDTFQRINFDSFDRNNYANIANDYFEHTALTN
jgi:hypothetical protein